MAAGPLETQCNVRFLVIQRAAIFHANSTAKSMVIFLKRLSPTVHAIIGLRMDLVNG